MKTKATLLIAVLAATPLFAANVVQNGSFELPEVGSSACFTFSNPPFPLCSVPNWTGSFAVDGDQSGGTVSGPPPSPIPAGDQWAMVFNSDSISQDVNISQAGTYTLTWFDAGRGQNPFNVSGAQSYNVLFGGNLVNSFSTTTGSGWTSRSASLSLGTGTFTLSFAFTGGGGAAAYLDNIQLNLDQPATVGSPEPTTLASALAAVALFAWRSRRRLH